jgi:hypothetical protein
MKKNATEPSPSAEQARTAGKGAQKFTRYPDS